MSDIRVENLRKEFSGGVVAVKDLNMVFASGTTTCLLGPSGCGKTTLMRMIAGLEKPTTGDIYFGDERVTQMSTRQRNIGMVFQYPVVYRGITVRQNIELPLKEERLSSTERAKRVDEVLDLLEMRESANNDVSRLDNGTRQKVAVARAVARHPRIILFDEPITNVDINSKLQLKRSLKELVTRLRQTIIYVTHDQTEAMTLADQIALMKDGAIVQMATPRELYNKPDDVFAGFFLGNPGMNFIEHLFEKGNSEAMQIPLFPRPLRLSGMAAQDRQITLGIRPEHILVSSSLTPNAVQASLLSKSIVAGGQYLLTLKVGGQTIKAKVAPEVGKAISQEVWVVLPLDQVRLFGKDGHKPDAALQMD